MTTHQCYCGKEIEFSKCCEPLIKGHGHAETPETLMRSRYSAFVVGDISYLRKTLAPNEQNQFDEPGVREWSKAKWHGLNILKAEQDLVEFIASYEVSGKIVKHHEISKFKKISGRWYFSGEESQVLADENLNRQPVVRTAPKVGRNDPCPCGSNKKFKKCCGANA